MSSDRMQDTVDPRFDGIYQRGGNTTAASPAPPPPPPTYPPLPPLPPDAAPAPTAPPSFDRAPFAPASTAPAPASTAPAVIREVGNDAVPPTRGRARNPYDVWLWVIAGASLALGAYFLWAPALYEQAYMERFSTVGPASTSYQGPPWFSYTVAAGPPLIFLGGATVVGQLALLSMRRVRQIS